MDLGYALELMSAFALGFTLAILYMVWIDEHL